MYDTDIYDDELEEIYEGHAEREENVGIEVTFKVKPVYEELFIRMAQATDTNREALYFNRPEVLYELIANINFDTMRVNKRFKDEISLYGDNQKRVFKQIKKNLKGKHQKKKNLYEKTAEDAFWLLKNNEALFYFDESNNFRSFSTYSASCSFIEIHDISQRTDGVYCKIASIYRDFDAWSIDIGKFLGTFSEMSKGYDVYLGKTGQLLNIDEWKTVKHVVMNDKLLLDLRDESKLKVPEQITFNLVDVSQIYSVEVMLEIKPEFHEVIKAVYELIELINNEKGMLEECERLLLEFSILRMKDKPLDFFMEAQIFHSLGLHQLRDCEMERLIARVENDRLKKILQETHQKNIVLCDLAILSSITHMEQAGFLIDGETEKVYWQFKAEISGLEIQKINKFFNELCVNANYVEYNANTIFD